MRRLRLRCVSGTRRGQEFIFSGPRVRIGRSRDNDLVLPQDDTPASSAHHAEAVLDAGRWWLADAGSTNGTYVNGIPIARRRLAAGDVLGFGDDQFVVGSRGGPAWSTITLIAVLTVASAAAFTAGRRTPAPFEQIAATAARATYAIAVDDRGRRSIVGTAFAVDPSGLLGTNAHVADALRERNAFGRNPAIAAVAIRSDSFDARRVVAAILDPEWKPGSLKGDAALLRLEPGPPIAPLTLSTASGFERLERGTTVATFGFPAVSTDPRRPRGRLAVDVVGDVRGEYIEAGLAIAPGTSGSPVFDSDGSVVAIVAGGDFVRGEDGVLAPSGSRVNWAISVERVRALLGAR